MGVAWSNGRQFDASWDRGDTFNFRLGAGQVIEAGTGACRGCGSGASAGSPLPPHLAYGSLEAGGVIGPDETLVFVVDLVGVV